MIEWYRGSSISRFASEFLSADCERKPRRVSGRRSVFGLCKERRPLLGEDRFFRLKEKCLAFMLWYIGELFAVFSGVEAV